MSENWQCVEATGYTHSEPGRVATFLATGKDGIVLTVRNNRNNSRADGTVKMTRNEARALLRNLWILIDDTDPERF